MEIVSLKSNINIIKNPSFKQSIQQNKAQQPLALPNVIRPLPSTELYLSFLGNVKMSNKVSFGSKPVYNIALSEAQLDDYLDNKTKFFNFNPVKEYEQLAEGDKIALKHLVKAAKALDDVFLKQDHPRSVEIRESLQAAAKESPIHAKALRLFKIFNGPEGMDGVSEDPIRMIQGEQKLEYKNIFPADITEREVLDLFKTKDNQFIKDFFNCESQVQRINGELKPVPYHIAFEKEYQGAAKELKEAAKHTTHSEFAKYLNALSEALRTGDPQKSCEADMIWASLEKCPLEFCISKENYDDKFTSIMQENAEFKELCQERGLDTGEIQAKDMIGIRVGIVDLEGSEKLASYNDHIRNLGDELLKLTPERQYKQSIDSSDGTNAKQTLADLNLVYLNGDYAALRPGITIAQNLPNDTKPAIAKGGGRRNVFHKQVRRTIDPNYVQKLLDSLVDKDQHKWYDAEGDHLATIVHELTHSLGPMKSESGADKKALGQIGDAIEESKADLGSIASLDYFVKSGFYDEETKNIVLLTWAVNLLPACKLDSSNEYSDPYAVINLMHFNYLMDKGAIKIEEGGKLHIEPDKMIQAAKCMLKDIIELQLDGDLAKAKDYVDHWKEWTPKLDYISSVIKGLSKRKLGVIQIPLAEKLISE